MLDWSRMGSRRKTVRARHLRAVMPKDARVPGLTIREAHDLAVTLWVKRISDGAARMAGRAPYPVPWIENGTLLDRMPYVWGRE